MKAQLFICLVPALAVIAASVASAAERPLILINANDLGWLLWHQGANDPRLCLSFKLCWRRVSNF